MAFGSLFHGTVHFINRGCLAQLRNKIYHRLREKIRYERIKNNPVLSLDFDGEELKPVEFDVSDIRKDYEKKTRTYQRYIDGYFTGEDGRIFAIILYPPETATGVDFGRRMLKAIKTATAEVCAGHALGAAGVNEIIYSLLMLNGDFVVGSANIDNLDPAAEPYPIVRENRPAGLETVMSKSFGFGGTNATLIFGALL